MRDGVWALKSFWNDFWRFMKKLHRALNRHETVLKYKKTGKVFITCGNRT